ncbi:MAG: histidine phosphatase family protein [Lautropia sp.]
MAELYLVRHAQAAFGTDDYDRLTPLGHQQARWLGQYFAERDLSFDHVLTGTLRRHRETVAGLIDGGARLAPVLTDAGLDEYDSERLVTAHLAASGGFQTRSEPPPEVDPGDAAYRKRHFQLLRNALESWTRGEIDAAAHRPYDSFQQQAYRAFELAWRAEHSDARRVLIVSSGGPISSIVARHLQIPPAGFVALNLQLRNSGFCEIRFGSRSARLISFNCVPHLDTLERRGAITFA